MALFVRFQGWLWSRILPTILFYPLLRAFNTNWHICIFYFFSIQQNISSSSRLSGSFLNCRCLFCLKEYLLPKWMNERKRADPYVKCLAHGLLSVGVTAFGAIIMIRMYCVQWEEPIHRVCSQLRQVAIFGLSAGISSTVLSLGKTTGSLSIVRSHEINCKNKS